MSIAKFGFDLLVYDDESSNNPKQRRFDWTRVLNLTNYSKHFDTIKSFPQGDTAVSLPDSPMGFLYIETDREISLKFNGSTDEVVLVAPSGAGTQDGVFFKRGEFTSLTIHNAAAEDANILIAMGK